MTGNPYAWGIWLIGATLPPILTRNPLYLILDLLAVLLLWQEEGEEAARWRGLLKLAFWLVFLSVPFNALTVHIGRIVLFRLPAGWPVVGGPVTLEAVLYGLSTGLALLALFQAFAVFNLRVNTSAVLRLVPPFLFEAGLVAAIGLSFMPQLLRSISQVRESQRLRGHRFRRIGDFLPLVMPVLAISMERSLELSESLASRGIGRHRGMPTAASRIANASLTAVGLFGLTAGVALGACCPARKLAAWGMGIASMLLLTTVFYLQGRSVSRSRYVSYRWDAGALLVALAGLIPAAAVMAERLFRPSALVYYPYPPYSPWPPFDPALGIALAFLAAPAALGGGIEDGHAGE